MRLSVLIVKAMDLQSLSFQSVVKVTERHFSAQSMHFQCIVFDFLLVTFHAITDTLTQKNTR